MHLPVTVQVKVLTVSEVGDKGMTQAAKVAFAEILRQLMEEYGIASDKRVEDPSEWTEVLYR